MRPDNPVPADASAGDGILEFDAGHWRLRFTRHLPHPPAKVWQAITEAQHLHAWFPQQIRGDWVVGGRLLFVSESGDFEGEVLEYEPPTTLAFRWGTDVIRLEVAADGQGSRLTLLDTIDQHGKAARDAAGWHACLDKLEQHLAGGASDWTPGERWAAVHPRYVARFGPEASTVGPPPR